MTSPSCYIVSWKKRLTALSRSHISLVRFYQTVKKLHAVFGGFVDFVACTCIRGERDVLACAVGVC